MEKIRLVYDFDRSLIDVDSDVWVIQGLGSEKLYSQWREDAKSMQWNDLMSLYVKRLFDEGVTREQLEKKLQEIRLDDDMKKALQYAKEKGAEIDIISDANTFFINCVLEGNGCSNLFSKIITNPSHFAEDGKLHIFPLVPKDKPHSCSRCAINICKGNDINNLIQECGPFQTLIYVGDSKNDYCPALQLSKNDHVFARADLGFLKLINQDPSIVHARVHVWNNPTDIFQIIQTII